MQRSTKLGSQGSNNSIMKTRLLVVLAKDVSVTMSVKPMDENGLPVLSATPGSTIGRGEHTNIYYFTC